MHTTTISKWQHDHTFHQDQVKSGERKTIIVITITAAMMVIEIVTGVLFGSMALLADGLHMGSHAAALIISAVAYVMARKGANDSRFSFGTGKVNALAGYSSAIILAVFALMMAFESLDRFLNPVEIIFDQAILVSVIGLVVNLVCVFILGDNDHHHTHEEHDHHHDADHNLRAAYLHVLADALTSLLAIFALLAGKFAGLNWMDPLMGVVGAVMVARWSWGLLRDASKVLLDYQGSQDICSQVTRVLECDDDRVADLHVWAIGPEIYAASISIVSGNPRSPDHYKQLITRGTKIVHSVVEVHPCQG